MLLYDEFFERFGSKIGATLLLAASVVFCGAASFARIPDDATRLELGRVLFSDKALSRDGQHSCASCHDAAHAYADPHVQSVGVDGQVGTRNAPSLVGIGNDTTFFWDGRRVRLEDAATDPITNPAELGWPSIEALVDKLRGKPELVARFRAAFPQERTAVTPDQLKLALAAFVRSLRTGTSAFDQAVAAHRPLSSEAELGRQLFNGAAQCNECHRAEGTDARFSDGQFHHSGIGQAQQAGGLPQLTHSVIAQNLDADHLGPKLLTDPAWSSLGRFVVTHKPADIGAFSTPSLRNVAVTAPYMHDGSIATLNEAVDHEIYYHALRRGRPINLSQAERQSLVAFLETLTDSGYTSRTAAQ